MGVAGLIFGILSIIVVWIPFVVYFAGLFAILGTVLSAIAMNKAKKANLPAGLPIAGLVISIIGLVIWIPRLICAVACAGAVGALGSGLW